jgi:NAD(P)-dependent dehydrogenase (short-subunit alcohol dehydrogenase family)
MGAKTIIVTGASRGRNPSRLHQNPKLTFVTGIGLAIAKYLLSAPQSHNVVVVARSVEPLQKLKEQYSKQVEVVNGDLADFSIAQKVVDTAIKTFGQLDGMVLNHGILGQVGTIATADLKEWQSGFDVNFISLVAFVCRSILNSRCLQTTQLTQSYRLRQLSRHFASPREKSFSPPPAQP